MAKCQGCRDGAAFPFQIRTAFQPIVDIQTGKVHAYEALVRGPNGEGAAVVLDRVTETNRYAFDQACRVSAIRTAVAAGLLETDARLSINFLPNAVYSPLACIQATLQAARETGLDPARITFEFTENERLDTRHVRSIIEAYRTMGFQTAIDDFGAGHSGLGLLANLQPDVIKLDMELVRGLDESLPRRIIVAAIVRLAKELGIKLVAEGVETRAELEAIRSAGIRYVQGFLFAKPELDVLPTIAAGAFAIAKAA
ncbi:EAL domain-containing protein [Sphingosinicella rhizophila]|uniref:EAL domain-containing protein n=1 Tax=Sphingosinicella rhizophila TaxID=3050082 RepID=A0ABU3QAY9_9SPHN|nr:EAL domain-containing protein [Sphingosinicella sp. GR2756]MDT9600304.1 EAL domain-containing protein [Sphingosinicella sp. GR2756]